MFKYLIVLLASAGLFAFTSDDCKCLHDGKFKYYADEEEILVTIKDSTLTEFHSGGKYQVNAKLEWLSDCEYNLTVVKTNVPDFPYGPGDSMNVKIIRVDGDDIFYTATVGRVSWEGKFIKVRE